MIDWNECDPGDAYFDDNDDRPPRKRRLSCQCGTDLPGTCPGVENCPHSGYGDDDEEESDDGESA